MRWLAQCSVMDEVCWETSRHTFLRIPFRLTNDGIFLLIRKADSYSFATPTFGLAVV